MHDNTEHKAQSMTPGDFQAIVNTFTQGLRGLPTDSVTRVKNFLAEYLGTSRHPVPFGGRHRDFEQLDTWLADPQSSPYLLIAAPAGRGKSALLLRWCQRLFTRRNLAVAYFPVSIRFRTNLAGVALPALVALLANLHGEKVPADPNLHEEVWRGLLTDYLSRPLPNHRSLVLVLDGIDEAADWTPGPDLFPQNPPPSLRIVLSARYLANDHDATAWLQRLGWTHPDLARTLELHPLDRSGVASVLLQMGFPLDLLSTRVNIVSELYRLSEGDPLLVRLYVDDLWERGESAVRLQPEDLRAIRPGLLGYFDRWWQDQRLLWSQHSPEREASTQALLALLAGALGPLSKEDILNLAPSEAGLSRANLDQHLASLSRFVIGDGMRQGYVFSHPRLANYFLEERLTPAERTTVEQRFLAWGAQTLSALDAGTLPPEQASPYIIQYYGAHLERAHADPPALFALVSAGWHRAWEKLDRAHAGFLTDVERAWQAAEHANTASTSSGQPAPYLAEEIRCLLCRVSINSMTSNISPRLMLEAVKTAIWTPAQGLACIRLIPDLTPRARELVGLAPYVQEPLRSDILQEALDTIIAIKDERYRLDALVELAPELSTELLWQVLDLVPTIDDEADRAEVLAELAPVLSRSAPQLEHALELAQQMEDEEYLALALTGLAPYLPSDHYDPVLQRIQSITDERYRSQALIALLPYLSEPYLLTVFQKARDLQDGLSHVRLLTALVAYLPDPAKTEAITEAELLVRDILDREYRIEILVKLAPFLPAAKIHQALQEVLLLWDESARARALIDLLSSVPEEHLPTILQAVRAMNSDEYRMSVLLHLLPRLPEALLEQVIEIVDVTWDEGCRVEILAKLAQSAPPSLIPRLLETRIDDHGYRVWLFAELETSLPQKLGGQHFNMLAALQTIHPHEERVKTLLAIISRLSKNALAKIFDEMLPDIFGSSWAFRSDENRAHILTKLAPHLTASWLERALSITHALTNELYQVQILRALAPRLPETLLPHALDIVRAMQDREKRAQVLELLVSSLPAEHKAARVQEMLQVLQIIKDDADRAHLFNTFASNLPSTLPPEKIPLLLTAVRTMYQEASSDRILKILAAHAPPAYFEMILSLVPRISSDEDRAHILEALAPRLPEHLWLPFLDAFQTLENERWRAQVLATFVSHASSTVLNGLLQLSQMTPNESDRITILRALGSHSSETTFAQFWTAIQAIKDPGRRVWVLGALALSIPEGFFPQLWDALLAIPNPGWQIWALGSLVPHMPPSMFSELWEAIQAQSNHELYSRMLMAIVPHAPETLFPEIWEAAQPLSNLTIRVRVLEALARRVPEHLFPQLFQIVRAIPDEAHRVTLFEALAPHLPEAYLPAFWKELRQMKRKEHIARMLVALAPHMPARFLPRFWRIAQQYADGTRKLLILNTILPHFPPEKFAELLDTIPVTHSGQVDLLIALFPYLSPEQTETLLSRLFSRHPHLQPALQSSQVAWQDRWLIQILAQLLPYLPPNRSESLLPLLLNIARTTHPEEEQVWLLTKLIPHLPENQITELLPLLLSFKKNQHWQQLLSILLPSLSTAGQTTLLELTLHNLHKTNAIEFPLSVLKAASSLTNQYHPTFLYPILKETLHLLAQQTRRDTLLALAPQAPTLLALSNQDTITDIACTTLEIGTWWP